MAERKTEPAAAAPRTRAAQRVPVLAGAYGEPTPEELKQAAKIAHIGPCIGGRIVSFSWPDVPGSSVVRCPDCGAMHEEQRGNTD